MTFWDHNIKNDVFTTPTEGQLFLEFFQRIHHRVNYEHFNFLAAFYGRHRTGKSLAAVNFADMLDTSFAPNMEKRIVYTPKQFLGVLNQIRKQGEPGKVIIFDESAISYGSRDWYTQTSRALSHSLMALGYTNTIIFFVSQDLTFLDSQPRKLLNMTFEVTRYNNDFSVLKPFFLNFDTLGSGKIYKHYPLWVGRHQDKHSLTPVYKIKRIKVAMPPSDIVKRYESISNSFKDKTLENLDKEFSSEDNDYDIDVDVMTVDDIVDSVASDPSEFLTKRSSPEAPILSQAVLRHRYNITDAKAKVVKQLAENKIKK